MDHDIALHSILVQNMDRDVDMETMTENMQLVFGRLFVGTRVVAVKVIGKMDTLY